MTTLDTLPLPLTEETSVTLPRDACNTGGVRPLVQDNHFTALVRPTDADERGMVVDAPYHARWLGWHRGQAGAYGRTPREAVETLMRGAFTSQD